MRPAYIILLLCILGWLGRPGDIVLAQEATAGSQHPPYEDATTSLREPPTPQFFRLEADIAAEGIIAVRLRRDPAWLARTEPSLRLETIQSEAGTTESESLPRGSEVENLQQFLEQAIDRAQPDAASTDLRGR
jgi:hypothetical protein